MTFFKKPKIAQFFLEEEHVFTGKRKVRTGRMKPVLFALALLSIIIILAIDTSPGKKTASSKSTESESASSTSQDRETSKPSSLYEEHLSVQPKVSSPQHTASQLVRRSDSSGTTDHLPMGSTIPVRLVNTVLSADTDSPVIAEIPEDVYWKNIVIIPAGTRAIGAASLDETTQRLKARFHTLVYPDGSQRPINGLALLSDGSSGIPGDYHSQALRKQSGKFLGNFIGGLAEGLKERESHGQLGSSHEPGNLKNGILNGVASSTLEHAESRADDIKNIRPYLEVPGGTPFLIYLEKEYAQ